MNVRHCLLVLFVMAGSQLAATQFYVVNMTSKPTIRVSAMWGGKWQQWVNEDKKNYTRDFDQDMHKEFKTGIYHLKSFMWSDGNWCFRANIGDADFGRLQSGIIIRVYDFGQYT